MLSCRRKRRNFSQMARVAQRFSRLMRGLHSHIFHFGLPTTFCERVACSVHAFVVFHVGKGLAPTNSIVI